MYSYQKAPRTSLSYINITAFYATPHYTTRLRQFRSVAGLHKSIMLNSHANPRSPTLKIGRCTCLNGEESPNPSGFSVTVFALSTAQGKKRRAFSPFFFSPNPPHAKNHARKARQMFMFKWGLLPQTPEPPISRAMLTESFPKITSNPSITRPIEGRNPRTNRGIELFFSIEKEKVCKFRLLTFFGSIVEF